MKNNSPIKRPALAAIGAPIGLALIFLASMTPFFLHSVFWAQDCYRYVYAAGALLMLVVSIFTPYQGKDMRLKRLYRIEGWSAIFFIVGAAFLFYDHGTLRDWIAFTLAGAFLRIYTSIAIPNRIAKADKED